MMEESGYPGAPVIAPVSQGPNVSPVLRALSPGRGQGHPGGSSPQPGLEERCPYSNQRPFDA